MENCKRFVPRHIYFVENTESAFDRTLIHRPRSEHYFTVFKCISTDHSRGIHVYMERNIPVRTAERIRKSFGKNVFARRFCAAQKNIRAAQNCRERLIPHLRSVI